MYIGRQKELELLNGFYEGNECKVACIRGSLGMGKTTMARHFAEDKDVLFFTAYETTGKQQVSMLGQQFISETIRANGNKSVNKKNISKMSSMTELPQLLDEITERAAKGKLLVVIDRYTNFVKADNSFNDILVGYVKKQWKDLPVKLLLIGDAYILMEKQVVGKKAPWKGLIDLDIELGAMRYDEAKEFLSYASPAHKAILYGMTGGIPGQLAKVSRVKAEPKEALKVIFGGNPEDATLLPEQIMGSELRELSYYNCLLTAMAKGMNRVNQLSAEVEKPKDVVVPYLNALMSIGIVTKQNAITEESNRKKTRYLIVNTNVIFWYKYIVPHFDLYMEGRFDELWDNYIANDLNDYMQDVLTRMSREYLETQSDNGNMPFTIERSGNWWVNDDEAGTTDGFDVVSLGKTKGKSATIFTLCFYDENPVEIAEIKGLIDKTRQLNREGDVFYVACSNNGFNETAETVASTIKNIILIEMEEMCK